MKSDIRLNLDTLERRETPSAPSSLAIDGTINVVPAMSPSESPVIVEPETHIILPGGN